MENYELVWKKSAEKDLKKIDSQYIPQIIRKAENLSSDPFPENSRKIQGAETSYRIRIGDYRIIYQVDSGRRIVIIFHVRHRKDAYRK
jgi:mRNA interferase RelE/StbE